MVTIKKGRLYRDGKAVFGVGVSYYASYHARKVPVPPDEKVVFTPTVTRLALDEQQALAGFAAAVGMFADAAGDSHCCGAYHRLGVRPQVTKSESRDLLMETLTGDGYALICLTNGTNLKKPFENVQIRVAFDFREATLYTFENPTGAALAVRDRSFVVDRIGDGGFVLLK